MKLTMTHAAIHVSNVKQTSEFLQKVLDFKPAWQQDDWGMIKGNGTTLALVQKETEVHPPHIGFVVPQKEDVDTKYEELKKETSLKALHEPKDHRDKSRSFYFQDQDSNWFEILWLPDNLKH